MNHFLRQSTTATIKLGPFVQTGDVLTPYTLGGFTAKLAAAGGALAARHDSTAITHDADGYYSVELDATDTATVGRLKVEVPGSAGTYFPVWADYSVLSQAVYDTLFGATALSTYAGGAVASVTGAVGSVTGAVGSVTGNVGGNVNGNVVGSVGSVAGAVASVTGNVGGNVVGSVGSVAGAVASVTGNVGGNVVGSVASVTAPVTVETNNDKTGYGLSGGERTALAGVILSDTTDPLGSDIVTTAATAASLSTSVAALTTSVAAIKVQTDQLAGEVVVSAVADTAATETQFKAASGLPTVPDAFKNMIVLFTGGNLAGRTALVTAYNGAARQFTVRAGDLWVAPSDGDPFQVLGLGA